MRVACPPRAKNLKNACAPRHAIRAKKPTIKIFQSYLSIYLGARGQGAKRLPTNLPNEVLLFSLSPALSGLSLLRFLFVASVLALECPSLKGN
ncbi:hypothetical protein [Capybara microvirus Cap1_SP_137]|nr:hypothetical protein [Capybara microvirus Cap1_SP_137]